MIRKACNVYAKAFAAAEDAWPLWILFVAILLAAAFALDGCAPSPPPAHPSARVAIHNERVSCSGVRIGRSHYLTARHCGRFFEIDSTGEVAIVSREYPRDLVELDAASASPVPLAFFPPRPYRGDDLVRLDLRRGSQIGYVTERGWDWIRISAKCFPGDSGSPVFASNGLVGIVSRRSPTACVAVLTVVE